MSHQKKDSHNTSEKSNQKQRRCSIINAKNINISDIDEFLGKIQNAFISEADIVLKRIFIIKIT